MRTRLLAGFLAALLLAPPAVAQALSEPAPAITVTGEGSVDLPPDMATLHLGVTSEAKTAAGALAATSEGMAAVLAVLAEAGVEGRDIQTSGLALMPRRDDYRSGSAEEAVTGFIARNGVTVRLRDLARLGTVLDRVVASGANTFEGLTFGLSDPSAALAEARRRAVADARLKAETFAGAAGLALGPVRSMADQSGHVEPMQMRMASEAMPGVPVAAGEVSVRASVTVSWTLAP